MTTATPFTIDIDESRLQALRQRLDTTVWPDVPAGADGHGIAVARVQELAEHWRHRFDWRAFEAELNELDHYLEESGDYPLHLVHQRAPEPTGVPVVLLHGWPDTFLRYRRLIGLLTAAGHDVVVPSLPGFGFSGQPVEPLTTAGAAERVHQALQTLGVQRYAVHGGDFGSVLADELVQAHPESIAALHLTDVPFPKNFAVDRATLSAAERELGAKNDDWMENAVYFTVQAAEPLTLAYGLSDSPVGLLAWFADKFDVWSDEVDPDDVVAITALTWLTGTVWSGFRLYADDTGEGGDWGEETDPGADGEDTGRTSEWGGTNDGGDTGKQTNTADGADGGVDAGPGWAHAVERPIVPTGFSVFPRDISYPPREYCERFYDVIAFQAHDQGGHFAALERPDVLARDIITFLAAVRDVER